MEELKKNKDSLNGFVDHENDVKQKRKSTINRLVVLCQKWIL
jgi:hypothetical protein